MFRFSLGRIPITVHPWFLFMALIFGAQLGNNVAVIGAWILIVFASVLAHELGHAFCGIAFGLTPRIDLHGMGGTTSWEHKDVSTARKIAISVAGPAVGIAIGGALYLAQPTLLGGDLPRIAKVAVLLLVEVNLYWGALNLLPMMPLDGGNAMAHVLAHSMGSKGMRIAHYVSIPVAFAAGIGAYFYGWGLYSIFLAAYFAWLNLRAVRPKDDHPAQPSSW